MSCYNPERNILKKKNPQDPEKEKLQPDSTLLCRLIQLSAAFQSITGNTSRKHGNRQMGFDSMN